MHVFFCVSKNVSVSCAYTQGKREQFSGFNRTLDAINNVFRKFSAFHDETGRLNVDGMNIISNDGSNKLNRSRKARVSYKVQRTINASLNAATSTRAVSSNPNFVTRQYPTTKIRVNATCRKCPHKVHRMEMKTAISCTILRHTKILIAVGARIIRLATLRSQTHTPNTTQIVTQSIGIIIKRL